MLDVLWVFDFHTPRGQRPRRIFRLVDYFLMVISFRSHFGSRIQRLAQILSSGPDKSMERCGMPPAYSFLVQFENIILDSEDAPELTAKYVPEKSCYCVKGLEHRLETIAAMLEPSVGIEITPDHAIIVPTGCVTFCTYLYTDGTIQVKVKDHFCFVLGKVWFTYQNLYVFSEENLQDAPTIEDVSYFSLGRYILCHDRDCFVPSYIYKGQRYQNLAFKLSGKPRALAQLIECKLGAAIHLRHDEVRLSSQLRSAPKEKSEFVKDATGQVVIVRPGDVVYPMEYKLQNGFMKVKTGLRRWKHTGFLSFRHIIWEDKRFSYHHLTEDMWWGNSWVFNSADCEVIVKDSPKLTTSDEATTLAGEIGAEPCCVKGFARQFKYGYTYICLNIWYIPPPPADHKVMPYILKSGDHFTKPKGCLFICCEPKSKPLPHPRRSGPLACLFSESPRGYLDPRKSIDPKIDRRSIADLSNIYRIFIGNQSKICQNNYQTSIDAKIYRKSIGHQSQVYRTFIKHPSM